MSGSVWENLICATVLDLTTKVTVSKVLFSSEKQDWGTPPELYSFLDEKYGHFELDAATSDKNPLGTPYFYTIKDNALDQAWKGKTYVNPPYGRDVGKWVLKAYTESVLGSLVVMLLPARTDTRWFHTFIYNRPKVEVVFLKGRLRMFNYQTEKYADHVAPFPSMIVVFRP